MWVEQLIHRNVLVVTPASFNRVSGICLLVADVQVRRVDAERRIAAVEDPLTLWDRAIREHPGDSMSAGIAVGLATGAIPPEVLCASPEPAALALTDLGPK